MESVANVYEHVTDALNRLLPPADQQLLLSCVVRRMSPPAVVRSTSASPPRRIPKKRWSTVEGAYSRESSVEAEAIDTGGSGPLGDTTPPCGSLQDVMHSIL